MENIFGNRLKQERLRLRLSQEDVGCKANISKQTVSHYERGNKNPTVETLAKLADIFDCSTDYLLGRTDDRDNLVYSGNVDGHNYKLEIDKKETDLPDTEEKFKKLIKKLEEIGFDVDKLMDEDKFFNLND